MPRQTQRHTSLVLYGKGLGKANLHTHVGLSGKLTVRGWSATSGLPFGDWLETVKKLIPAATAVQFAVGDAILFGQKTYGKRQANSAIKETTGYASHTLYIYTRIAERVPHDVRTPELTFYHHMQVEVFHGKPALQRKWLNRAIQNHWTHTDLKEAIGRELASSEPKLPRASRPAGELLRDLLAVNGQGTVWLAVLETIAAEREMTPEELARDIIFTYLESKRQQTEDLVPANAE